MGTVVDVTLSTDRFALTETFDTVSDATFEPIRVASHGSQGAMRLLWATSSELDRLDEALRADGTTGEVTRLSMDGERSLYRIEWCARTRTAIEIFARANGTILDAHGASNQWEIRILFPDQASVSAAYDDWREHGIDPSIHQINSVSDTVNYGGMGLSSCQHEALTEAFRTGYYNIPRDVTLDDLASDFDVSHQALSERFRRGHRTLVETALCQSPTSAGHQP